MDVMERNVWGLDGVRWVFILFFKSYVFYTPFHVYIYLTVSFKKKKKRLNQAKHSTQNRIGPIV